MDKQYSIHTMEEKETKVKRRWEREREARQNESKFKKKGARLDGGKNNLKL